MSETKNTGDRTLGVSQRKTLGIKRGGIERDTVRQSFSHGRTNTVVVEKKKRRIVPSSEQKPEPVAEAPRAAAAPQPAPEPRQPAPAKSGMVLRTLSEDELDARAKALADARVREAEERRTAEADAVRRAEEEERLAREREEAERRQAEEDTRRQAELEARERAEETARRRLGDGAAPAERAEAPAPRGAERDARHRPSAPKRRLGDGEAPAERAEAPAPRGAERDEDDAEGAARSAKRVRPAEPKPVRRTEDRRRGKLTLVNALDDSERERSLASVRRRRERERARQIQQGPREKVMREVVVPETITIQELANRMTERASDVIKLLMKQGQLLKINDVIDADMAQLIAEEMGHTVKRVAEADVVEGLFDVEVADDELTARPPVVTIMGHVDHGKTSLLDKIRAENVVAGEAGGITQHIGAYQVEQKGHRITFIDTPGHAAFTAMRARGAKVTDIVVLVVAADDGVMPQTAEAIDHARAAGAPIIVAINKIDKPDADPNRVRTELLQHELVVESLGGDIQEVEVSALQGTNLDKLLDAILLQAEIQELKAKADGPALGVVIEAKLDRGRGPVASVLVQHGELEPGDIVVAGAEWGKVRALVDDQGNQLKSAGPSQPVEVLGFQGTPDAGDPFVVVESEARAREIADYRQRQKREKDQARITSSRGSLEQMLSQLQVSGRKDFPLLIKADVQGSVEAIGGALDNLGTDEVGALIVRGAVGGITESDVTLAAASGAAILGFNVRANKQARDAAEATGVDIRYYNVIYALVDDVKAAMSGLLSPERRETMLGNAEILEVFSITKVGKVAGCRVTDGTVERGASVRLIRDDVVIHEGKLSTLKRFKDEVREVVAGQECGMAFENYQDMRPGDIIECYRVEEIKRSL